MLGQVLRIRKPVAVIDDICYNKPNRFCAPLEGIVQEFYFSSRNTFGFSRGICAQDMKTRLEEYVIHVSKEDEAMKKIFRHLSAGLVLAALLMNLCMPVAADDFSVTVEKVGEIPNILDVFTGGEQKSFSYMFLGSGFGVLDENRKIKVVDVNGENHIDKLYDRDIQKLYHGRYQFGNPVSDKDEKQYDLIKECSTVCYSNIQARIDLHDDLFVFATDGNYVVFDLDEAKELAKVPASKDTHVGIFDDDYFIFRNGKNTFYDDDGKEVYSTGNKVIMGWDGKLTSYDHTFFVEKTEDQMYHIMDTDYKEVRILNALPDRILHGGQYYVMDQGVYDQKGKLLTSLPGNDRVYELENGFLVQDLTDAKKDLDYNTYYLYDYSGEIKKTFETKSSIGDEFGYGYYVLKGKDPSKDMDSLICPDGTVIEGRYDGEAVFGTPDSTQDSADLYVINDRDFTLKGMNERIHSGNYELLSSPDTGILAKKASANGKKEIEVYNVLDGKVLLDTDIRNTPGYVGDYIVAESASDSSRWTVYRMKIDD